MKNKGPSIDGFKPRRSGDLLGASHNNKKPKASISKSENRQLHNDGAGNIVNLGQSKDKISGNIGRSDIDDSLRDIDNLEEPVKKLSRRQKRRIAKRAKKPRSLKSKIIRWFILIFVVAILSVGGFALYKLMHAGGNILQGNVFNVFQNQPLKQDSNGRSNFLILGSSDDDSNHDGADLTDSMLVVSVNQNSKDIYMFSVPRDLYVEYGSACVEGYAGKINSYFSCVDSGTDAQAEQARLAGTQKLVGDIFGLDIQYGIHINRTVIQESVDAVDGVDVDVQGSNGDPGVLDRSFDGKCNFTCYYVKYDNGVHHLDGEHALFLAQARGHSAPTYGLGNSNFDREKNQQKILIALKEKAMSTGTLTNLSAVTKLLDAMGNNLRTNIQTSEIRTIMQVASDITQDNIHTISLFGDENAVVVTGAYGGASAVAPSAGVFDYSEIQALIAKNLTSNPVTREAAPIVVLNGTGQSGYGQTKADALASEGFNVSLIDNAPDGTYGKVEIYKIGDGNSATADKLSNMFNVSIKSETPPITVNGDVRFVVIFGATS